MSTTTPGSPPPAPALDPADAELIRAAAGTLLEITPELGVAMARHLHEQVSELGGINDADAVEATRASCEGNVREILIMQRAGLPATAHETPAGAREYAIFMRRKGVGLQAVLHAYLLGVAFFQPIVQHEFERRAESPQQLEAVLEAAQAFLWVYIDRVTAGLAAEYGAEQEHWLPPPEDPVWQDPSSIGAAEEFEQQAAQRGPNGQPSAHDQAAARLERFGQTIAAGADNELLSRRLALADTTVRIELADEDDLALTLLFDRTPVEVVEGSTDADVSLTIASIDLDRLWLEDFHLPMAIVRGRVLPRGPVRKFLRVMPIVRGLNARLNDPDPADDVASVASKID
jgi:hypothetical protein